MEKSEEERVARLRRAFMVEMEEVSQTLAGALKFPRYVDDPENFPGATKYDGYIVAEPAEVLAMLAAQKIEELQAEVDRLQKELNRVKDPYGQD